MPPESSRPGAHLPRWGVTSIVHATYAGYAALLLVAAFGWLAVLFDHLVYGRVELGLLGQGWLETARALRRLVRPLPEIGFAAGGLGFLLAFLPWRNAEAVLQAHKIYQRRAAAILLLLLGLVWLSQGRMGAFDADIAAAAVFAWGAWAILAGWRAWAGGRAVAGPAGWGFALAADVLALATLAVFWIGLEIEGIRVI